MGHASSSKVIVRQHGEISCNGRGGILPVCGQSHADLTVAAAGARSREG